MTQDLLAFAARILCCPDCSAGLDAALVCRKCRRPVSLDEDNIIGALPAPLAVRPAARDEIQVAIEEAGPGEHGERVVQYEQAFHDEQAAYYDKLFADPLPLLAYYKRLISRQVYSYVKSAPFVVDLCCGTGKSSLPLIEKGLSVVAIDVSLEMLRVYRRKCLQRGLKNVIFVHADASRPPLVENSCSAIMMIGGLHHIRDQEGSVACCHRALSPDGVLVLHEPIQTGCVSRLGKLLDNVYAAMDPGRVWRAVKRRVGAAVAPPPAPDSALCDFTPYERPFHSAEQLLALMPAKTSVVALRSQGLLSFRQFAPSLQRVGWISKPLAAAVVQLDHWSSGDARRRPAGDALFAVCRKNA